MSRNYLLCLLFGLSLIGAQADPLPVGAAVPKLTAIDQDGAAVDLGTILSTGTTLVYFYPKAGSTACTAQACKIGNNFEPFQNKGITVIGVSSDKPDSLKNFHERFKLPFTLISDSDRKVAEAFGVPQLMFGWDKRQSFLVRDGKIVWEDLDVDADKHADQVLKAFDSLPKS
jgi:peroxiredoxin Q/BCP